MLRSNVLMAQPPLPLNCNDSHSFVGAIRRTRRLPLERTVRAEEAYRICKSERRWADRRVVGVRKIDSVDEIKTASVEEHVDGEASAVDAINASIVLEPDASRVALARLVRDLRFAAIHGDE